VAAALTGSFNIWQKKCRYTSPVVNKPKNMLDWIMNIDDYHDENRRDDVITKSSQVGLFQEVNMVESRNIINIENTFL
jgi:hypothetical protein